MKKIKSLINKGLRNEKGFTLIEMKGGKNIKRVH